MANESVLVVYCDCNLKVVVACRCTLILDGYDWLCNFPVLVLLTSLLSVCNRIQARRAMRFRAVPWSWSTALFLLSISSRCQMWHKKQWKHCCVCTSLISLSAGTPRLPSTPSGTSGMSAFHSIVIFTELLLGSWRIKPFEEVQQNF